MYNRGVSLVRAVDWNVNERFVCTSCEFWQLILIVLDGIFLMPKLSVLSRAVVWNTNERDVCRALSFGNLFFLLWMNFFYAKTQRKVRFTIEVCPWFVCLKKRLLYFCVFLTFSFGYVKIVLWKYCLLM